MADSRTRKLSRNVNDNPMQALAQGARMGNVDLVLNSLSQTLSTMPLGDQRLILTEVANAVKRTTEKTAQPKNTKAFTIRGPSIGKVTPAQFVSIINKAVEDALNGVDNDLVGTGYNASYRSKQEKEQAIRYAFNDWSGAYLIGFASDVRIFALHEAPTKEEAVKRAHQRKLAQVRDGLEKKKAALEKAAAKEKRLKAELEKLAKDEERYKKSVEKAEKEYEKLQKDT